MTDDVAQHGPFRLEVAAGIAVATFDRPPVNAVDLSSYQALRRIVDEIDGAEDVRVLVLTGSPSLTSWCGGADLNDFVGIDAAGRRERYRFINETIPALHDLDRPVIAAITGHAIGIGVLLAAVCDLRIASRDALFSCPEIDYGLVAGSSRLLNYLGLPEALVREMTYTSARLDATRLLTAGFLNSVVPREDVLGTALALARVIADKSLPALRARKTAFVQHQELGWLDAYRLAQRASAELVELDDSRDGVNAFLNGRPSVVRDR